MTRSRSSRLVRRAAVPVVALAVTSVLGACGSVEAGSAAVVGDRRISVYDVQRATADVQAYFGADQQVAQQQVLFFLISGPYIVDAAAKAGVGVSADDARVQLASKLAGPSGPGIAVFQANEAITRIGSLQDPKKTAAITSITDAFAHTTVTVNPRYGTFDAQKLQIVAADQNWIVPPSAEPSPAAAPEQSPAPDTSAPDASVPAAPEPAPSAS